MRRGNQGRRRPTAKSASRRKRQTQRKGAPPGVQPCGVPFLTGGIGLFPVPPINAAVLRAVKRQATRDCIARAVAICLANPLCPNASFIRKLADFAFIFGGLLIHIVIAEWVCVPGRPIPFPPEEDDSPGG